MKDPLQPNRCAELLSALAAPERLRIVRFLREGPRNVTEIAEMLGTTVVNVSHHLAVLRHAVVSGVDDLPVQPVPRLGSFVHARKQRLKGGQGAAVAPQESRHVLDEESLRLVALDQLNHAPE